MYEHIIFIYQNVRAVLLLTVFRLVTLNAAICSFIMMFDKVALCNGQQTRDKHVQSLIEHSVIVSTVETRVSACVSGSRP
jgi:hypothetical protein